MNNNNNINDGNINKNKKLNYKTIQNEKIKKSRAVNAKREYSKRPLKQILKTIKSFQG